MAHIPMDDINQLWSETSQHNWSAFQQTIRSHKGKANGISDNLIDMLMPIAEQYARSHHPFPNSPQEMYDMLNQAIGARR